MDVWRTHRQMSGRMQSTVYDAAALSCRHLPPLTALPPSPSPSPCPCPCQASVVTQPLDVPPGLLKQSDSMGSNLEAMLARPGQAGEGLAGQPTAV
jgi:hypothetical protein